MALSFDASGLVGFASSLDAIHARAREATRAVVSKASADVETYAKAAAPVDTGNLRASIGSTKRGPYEAEIGPTANYGGFVETGTSRMGPQPYMAPALERVEPSFVAAMQAVAEL